MRVLPGGVGKFERRFRLSSSLAVAWLAQGNFSSADQTIYTASAQSLGAAAGVSERRFYVVGVWGETSVNTVSSVTVRGQPGSQIAFVSWEVDVLAMWICEDTAPNTTGDVVMTFSAGMTDCGFALWRITSGLSGIALLDVASSVAFQSSPSSISVPLDVQAGGVQIGYVKYRKVSDPRAKWHTGAQRAIAATVADYSTAVSVGVADPPPAAIWTDLAESFDVVLQATGSSGGTNPIITASWRPAS